MPNSRKNKGVAAGAQIGSPRAMALPDSLLSPSVPSALNTTWLISREGLVFLLSLPYSREKPATPGLQTLKDSVVAPFTAWTPQHHLAASGRCRHLEKDKGQCHLLRGHLVSLSAAVHLRQGSHAPRWGPHGQGGGGNALAVSMRAQPEGRAMKLVKLHLAEDTSEHSP